jgi:hypothetical protein
MSKSVNKVFLVGNLTREPELIQGEGNMPNVPLGWQPTEAGSRMILRRNTKKQNSTALWCGISWRKRVISTCEKGEKSTLRDDYTPGPIPIRMASSEKSRKLSLRIW